MINIGLYSFINSLAIDVGIQDILPPSIALTKSTPSRINSLLLSEELDIGPISTAEYLKNKEKFILVNSLGIASDGPVGSVILLSRFPLKELKGKNIAITTQSATSVKLLKLLLLNNKINNVQFTVIDLSYKDFITDTTYDAILAIGDNALNFYNCSTHLHLHDLGQLWTEMTSLPMVYCLWVARAKWVEENAAEFSQLTSILKKALNTGLTEKFQEVLLRAKELTSLSEAQLKSYLLKQLVFTLEERHLKGLELFNCQLTKNNLLY